MVTVVSAEDEALTDSFATLGKFIWTPSSSPGAPQMNFPMETQQSEAEVLLPPNLPAQSAPPPANVDASSANTDGSGDEAEEVEQYGDTTSDTRRSPRGHVSGFDAAASELELESIVESETCVCHHPVSDFSRRRTGSGHEPETWP
jgi:hypothetical protein